MKENLMQTAGPSLVAAGQLPPGTSQLSLIVAWATGLVGLALFLGFIFAMGKTGLEALTHGQFTGGKGAIICLVCAVFLGAATAIFAALGVSGV